MKIRHIQVQLGTQKRVLEYVREHADSVDRAYVFLHKQPQFKVVESEEAVTIPDVGMTLVPCSGGAINLNRRDAAVVLNDGILTRMQIKTTFH